MQKSNPIDQNQLFYYTIPALGSLRSEQWSKGVKL